MAALMPLPGSRGRKKRPLEQGGEEEEEEEEEEGEEEGHEVKGSRLGASEIFHCPPDERIHLSFFMSVLRDIKKCPSLKSSPSPRRFVLPL